MALNILQTLDGYKHLTLCGIGGVAPKHLNMNAEEIKGIGVQL